MQRPDASGARTPPVLEKEDEFGSSPSSLSEVVASLSGSLKDSLGSRAARMHERTPPESPRHDGDDEDDEEEGKKEKQQQQQQQIAEKPLSGSMSGGIVSGVGIVVGSGSSSVGTEQRPRLVATRARSASVGLDGARTPPGSPPHSPEVARSPPPSSPFRWGERLTISPEAGKPAAVSSLRIGPEPRFNLLDSSSSDMTMSGQHLAEIGFERSEKALGQGAFGKVWLGLRDNGEFLAIKEIQIAQGDKYAERLEAVRTRLS